MHSVLTSCLCLAHQRGFDSMDPFIPVSVPNYSEKEFESCYLYYIDRQWLQHPQSEWRYRKWYTLLKNKWKRCRPSNFKIFIFLLIRSNRGREERNHLSVQQKSIDDGQNLCVPIKLHKYVNHTQISHSNISVLETNIQMSMSIIHFPL